MISTASCSSIVSQMVIEREATRRFVENMAALSSQSGKPVATVMDIPFEDRVHLEKNSNFPFFLEPAEAVQALAVLSEWSKTDASDRLKPESDDRRAVSRHLDHTC